MTGEQDKWDQRYQAADSSQVSAATVLQEFVHLLPAQGTALDLACGPGGNALLLARQGLQVTAWDISKVAITRLDETARYTGLTISAEVRDVVVQPPAPASFDVIVVSHFLERGLCPALTAALKPGGLLYYQTFIADRVSDSGPRNPDYLLQENELLQLFSGLCVRAYREEGRVGDVQRGFRNQAMLVGQR